MGDVVKLAWLCCGMLAMHDGVKCIRDLPGSIYERSFGPWQIAMNGNSEPVERDGVDLPPFNVVVKFNGWPAGVIGPGGGILAAGAAANEDTFIAAIEAEIGRPITDFIEPSHG